MAVGLSFGESCLLFADIETMVDAGLVDGVDNGDKFNGIGTNEISPVSILCLKFFWPGTTLTLLFTAFDIDTTFETVILAAELLDGRYLAGIMFPPAPVVVIVNDEAETNGALSLRRDSFGCLVACFGSFFIALPSPCKLKALISQIEPNQECLNYEFRLKK